MQKSYILPIIILMFLLVPIASAMDAVNVINPPGTSGGNTYINITNITSQMNQTPNQTPGQSATIVINSTTTLAAGASAFVTNIGTSLNAIWDIGIPQGTQGVKGDPGAAGYTPVFGVDYFNGTDGTNGIDGTNATVTANYTFTLSEGSMAYVTNVGIPSNALFDFGIPQGAKGDTGANGINGTNGTNGINGINGTDGINGTSATVTINYTSTLPAGSSATVVNIGTVNDALLDFGIPTGYNGSAASVAVNYTFTIPAGNDANVTNVGTDSDVRLDFSIPAAPASIGSVWYLHNEASSDIAGDLIFSREYPSHAEGTTSVVLSSPGTETLVKQFISEPGDPSLNALPAGDRVWTVYGAVTSNVGTTDVVVRLYKYNTTTTAETELYNLTVGHYTQTIQGLTTTLTEAQDKPMNQSDRFLVKVYAITTANNNPTFTLYYDDSTHASEATSPINQGVQGAQGLPGTAATIVVNSTTNGIVGSNASVTNVGNTTAASFDFVIPIGATGAKGDPGATGGTGGQTLFYRHLASSEPITYEGLVPTPFGAAQVDENATINDVSGKVLIDAYITDVGYPAITTIPAGLWTFRAFPYVSNEAGVTTLIYDVYTRHTNGTETLQFTVTSPDINALVATAQDTYYAQSSNIYIASSDRIVIKVSVQTTKTGAGITYHWIYEGTTNNANVQTPIAAVTASALSFGVKSDGSALYKGQPVYISGATGGTPVVDKADNTITAKTRVIGLTANDVAANTNVNIVRVGVLTGVDTRSTNSNINPLGQTWVAGDLLFATTGGGLTNVRPTSGRSVKAAYTLTGSSATDSLLAYPFENPVWVTAASAEDVILRLGDSVGTNKVSIRNYSNSEVAYVNSQGLADFNGTNERANITMNNNYITGLMTGSSGGSAVNKSYVDSISSPINSCTNITAMYPVGSVYISTLSTNPATTFGCGNWSSLGTGYVLVGV